MQVEQAYKSPAGLIVATIEIPLSQGYVTRIEEADRAFTDGRKWHVTFPNPTSGYACTIIDGRHTYLHKLLCPDWDAVDHEDGDGLNNCRSNLRDGAGRGKNGSNTGMRSNNTSGYKGVGWNKLISKWMAHVKVNGKAIYLGSFGNPEDAADAYDRAAVHYFGEYAKTNAMLHGGELPPPRERPAPRGPVTHCLQGHPFDEENTYIAPKGGSRGCRICRRQRARKGGKPCPPGCTCGRHRRKKGPQP